MIKCELCEKEFLTLKSLSKHLNYIHKYDKQLYYNNYLLKSSLDGYCKTCGKPTKFHGLNGYSDHCNNICAQNDPEILLKIHTEEHEKHVGEGVKKAYNKETQRKRVESVKNTCLEKYGCTNPAQREDVKDKFKKTLLNKKEQFCKENNCTPRQELIKRYGQGWLILNIPTLKNGRVSYIDNKYIPIIAEYNSKSSTYENIIYHYLDSIYDGPIKRHARPSFLNGKELDFYLPDLNLAIEYNGSYYHCIGTGVGVEDPYYHYNKSMDCYLNGIRLIHIYEFESLDHQLVLLKSLIYYGFDRYNQKNPNKNWEYDDHIPEIIGYYNKKYPIYGA